MPGIGMNRPVGPSRQKTSRHNILTLAPMRQEWSGSDSSYTTPAAPAHSTHTHEAQRPLGLKSRCDWEKGI